MTAGRWPDRLWIVRHGESAGNIARDAAEASDAERIALTSRDVDVPLSPRGEQQARALAVWLAAQPEGERPEVVLVSPYLRAQDTARLLLAAGTDAAVPTVDERLREKEFGILDGLTVRGIHALQPEQAELRRLLGKFYHRPPGGESWCDVIFRLRSLLDTVALHHSGQRVMIVAHQVVVLCLRYIVEGLSEAEILAIDKQGEVANCSITEYRAGGVSIAKENGMSLVRYNAVEHLEADAAAIVTTEPERTGAARG